MAHRLAFVFACGGLLCITIDACEPKLLSDAASRAHELLDLILRDRLVARHREGEVARRHGLAGALTVDAKEQAIGAGLCENHRRSLQSQTFAISPVRDEVEVVVGGTRSACSLGRQLCRRCLFCFCLWPCGGIAPTAIITSLGGFGYISIDAVNRCLHVVAVD
jgi:hypothetical protein